jgi:hypothetical protein
MGSEVLFGFSLLIRACRWTLSSRLKPLQIPNTPEVFGHRFVWNKMYGSFMATVRATRPSHPISFIFLAQYYFLNSSN